jgi:uncharacterized protein involved in cysteine biosynthesis
LLWGAGIAASIFLPFIAVIIVLLFSALSFLISAYYYGFGFADFNWEASQVSRKETIQLARQNKMVLILLGAIYQALAALPFVGIPLGSVLCTAIAHLAGAENQ